VLPDTNARQSTSYSRNPDHRWGAAALYDASLPLSATWDSVTRIAYVVGPCESGPIFDRGKMQAFTGACMMIWHGYVARLSRSTH